MVGRGGQSWHLRILEPVIWKQYRDWRSSAKEGFLGLSSAAFPDTPNICIPQRGNKILYQVLAQYRRAFSLYISFSSVVLESSILSSSISHRRRDSFYPRHLLLKQALLSFNDFLLLSILYLISSR